MAADGTINIDMILNGTDKVKSDADAVRESINDVGDGAENTGGKFSHLKEIFTGTFLGGMLTNAVTAAGSAVKGLASEAVGASDSMDKFRSTMKLGGFGEDEINTAAKAVRKYADDTVYDLGDVSNTTAQLAANGIKNYTELTQAAGNLNAQAGGNADTFKSVAMVMTQTAGAGKLTTENWNQLADAIPGASGVLQETLKKNGAYTGNFRDAMSKGQITADEFNKAITQLGMNKGAVEAAKSTSTFEGAIGNLQATAVGAIQDIIDSFGKKKLTGAINSVTDAVSGIVSYIQKHKGTIGDIAGDIGKIVKIFGSTVWNVAKTVVSDVADAFSSLSGTSKKSSDPLDKVRDVLDKIAKNKNGIKQVTVALMALFAIKSIAGFVNGLMGAANGVKAFVAALKAGDILSKTNIIVLVASAVAVLVVAFVELYKHNKKFRDFVNGVIESAKDLAEKVGKWFGNLVDQAKTLASNIGKWFGEIGDSAKDLWNSITDVFTGQADWEKSIAKKFNKIKEAIVESLGAAVDWIGKNWKGLALLIVNPIAGGLKLLYDNNKGFRDWVNNLWETIQSGFKSIAKKVGGVWDNITDELAKGAKAAVKTVTGIFKDIGKTLLYAMMIPVGLVAMIVKPIIKPLRNEFRVVVEAVTTVWDAFTDWLSNSFNAVSKAWRKVWNAISDWFGDFFSGLKRDVNKWFKPIAKFFTDWLDDVHDTWIDTWDAISEWFSKFWKKLTLTIRTSVNKVSKIMHDALDAISDKWHDVWNAISSWFVRLWSTIHRNTSKGISKVKGVISNTLDLISDKWHDIWNAISSWFAEVWKTISGHARNGINKTKKVISDVLDAISDLWHRVWNSISSWFSDKWDSIKKTSSKGINSVHNGISGVLDKIKSKWHAVWGGLSSFSKDIWKDIKGYAADGINGVINVINAGVNAINGVWEFFTGKKTGIKKMKPVKFAQGGIVERHLSMVNDSPTENWKELIETPSGELMMAQDRNAILPLEAGTRVYNGDETKQIMSMAGVEHYKDGGIVGAVKDKLSDIGSWLGEKNEAITKFIEHPIKSIESIFEKSVSGMYSSLGNFGDLAKGVISKLTSPIGDWFKKGLKKVEEDLGGFGDAGGKHGNPGGSGVTRWRDEVKKALAANGLSTSESMIQRIFRQMNTESGGNPKAVQPGADPDGDGSGPAIGLMQTKRGTFSANAFPGHKDIFNGYDNLLAALHYAKRTYGPSLGFLGNGHGYANGGWSDKPEIFGEVEGEPEVVINPQRSSADRWLIEAMNARIKADPSGKIAKLAANLAHVNDPMQTNFSITTSGRNTQSFSDSNNGSAYSATNKSYVLNDSKVIELLQIIADKRTTVDGSSFASAYEQYGSTETARRNQLKGRGLAIDAKI